VPPGRSTKILDPSLFTPFLLYPSLSLKQRREASCRRGTGGPGRAGAVSPRRSCTDGQGEGAPLRGGVPARARPGCGCGLRARGEGGPRHGRVPAVGGAGRPREPHEAGMGIILRVTTIASPNLFPPRRYGRRRTSELPCPIFLTVLPFALCFSWFAEDESRRKEGCRPTVRALRRSYGTCSWCLDLCGLRLVW
jgi:hypothetical protein